MDADSALQSGRAGKRRPVDPGGFDCTVGRRRGCSRSDVLAWGVRGGMEECGVETSEVVQLGFSVADAKSPELHLVRQKLTVRFKDWQEHRVTLAFSDVIAVRWQEADHYVDDGDQYDSTVVVHDSAWLAEHERQAVTWENSQHQHLKLNFNAAGILEVLCTGVRVVETDSPDA